MRPFSWAFVVLQIENGRIVAAASHLAGTCKFMQVHRRLALARTDVGPFHLDEDARVEVGACVLILKQSAEELSFIASTAAGERAMHAITDLFSRKGDFNANELQRLIEPILGLIAVYRDEMEGQKVLVMPPDAAERFADPEAIFGGTVLDAFPSAQYDIQETGKCLALQRFTASVFHCMRIMEVGLEALGAELGLAVATNWNTALTQIEKEVRSRSIATHGPNWKSDETFFSEAVTHFRVVKNAWRNHTMHRRETFDEERARSVLQSTADFMRTLAGRLSE